MEQYNVTGMSCAACVASVERAVNNVNGVTSCSVSLLTNSMGVEGSAPQSAIISAVKSAGYGCTPKGATAPVDDDALKDTETPALLKRLIASCVVLVVLMYFSMGVMMFDFPVFSFLEGNHLAIALIELLLTIIIMIINRRFFVSGVKAVLHKSPSMDTLIALGAGASFLWSVYVMFKMTATTDHMEQMELMDQLYFESAAMILTLITIGKTLESYSKGKTTNALKSLMRLKPHTATIVVDGEEQTIDIAKLKKGDIFAVRPGEAIPADGIVVTGSCAVDESSLTGESIPVDKEIGSEVSSGTINRSGYIRCETLRTGEDTTLSKIIEMVSDAAATKAPIARTADKVSGVFVPAVICIAIITLIVWLILGREFSYALERAVSVLVISCPCALGLATPVAIMVGNGIGAKNGILFKTAVSLENTGKASTVVLDKTGTITTGSPQVTDVLPLNGLDDEEFLKYAAGAESLSEHPLAGAVVRYAEEKGISIHECSSLESLPGSGIRAVSDSGEIFAGNVKFMSSRVSIDDEILSRSMSLADEGKTILLFSLNDTLIGLIAVRDSIKEGSAEAVRQLKAMGLKVVMLTGDNSRAANAIGAQANVDEVIAEVLPDGKLQKINELKRYGRVIMVGDGINDAPALTAADIGIAIGAGSDIAIDAADVVVMKSSLLDVAAAVRLSRRTITDIHQNLFWAFIYNTLGIPLAAGVFVSLGVTLTPMIAAAAMSLSSFCVVMNALRLNLTKIYDSSHDRPRRQKETKVVTDEVSVVEIEIKGMMCNHCERRIVDALNTLGENAEADFESGMAHASIPSGVTDKQIKTAVKNAGYKVLKIKRN